MSPLDKRRLKCRSLSASLLWSLVYLPFLHLLLPLCPEVRGLTEHHGLIKPLASCQAVLKPPASCEGVTREADRATGKQGHLNWIVSGKSIHLQSITLYCCNKKYNYKICQNFGCFLKLVNTVQTHLIKLTKVGRSAFLIFFWNIVKLS